MTAPLEAPCPLSPLPHHMNTPSCLWNYLQRWCWHCFPDTRMADTCLQIRSSRPTSLVKREGAYVRHASIIDNVDFHNCEWTHDEFFTYFVWAVFHQTRTLIEMWLLVHRPR